MNTRLKRSSLWTLGMVACLVGSSLSIAVGEIDAAASATTRTSTIGALASDNATAAEGKSFAESLLAKAPLPNGATVAVLLPAPLINLPDGTGTVDVHQNYLLKAKLDLATFIASHRPSGAVVNGPNSENSGELSTTYEYSLPLANRHVAFESLDYTVGYASNGVEELRVDAGVDWVPIQSAKMPIKGVVTLTGFGRLSDMNPSSDPTSVTLSRSQAIRLRRQILTLSNAPTGGICMENSTLFVLAVAPGKGMPASWTATGVACPSYLNVADGNSKVSLVDTPCSLRGLIDAILPKGKAMGTRSELKFCGPTSEL